MRTKRRGVRGSTVRRVVQAAVLLSFFGLVLATRRGSHDTVSVCVQGTFCWIRWCWC